MSKERLAKWIRQQMWNGEGCSSLSVFAMIEVFSGEWLFLGERIEEIPITNVYAFPKQVQEVLEIGEKVQGLNIL